MTDFCNLSASRLTRIFREQTGMTSKNYIDSLKMQLASEMLAVKNKTVKEISGILILIISAAVSKNLQDSLLKNIKRDSSGKDRRLASHRFLMLRGAFRLACRAFFNFPQICPSYHPDRIRNAAVNLYVPGP